MRKLSPALPVAIAAALALMASPAPGARGAAGRLSQGGANETVFVNLAAPQGPPTYRASGFIFGFSRYGNEPPDELTLPLKIRLNRSSTPGDVRSQTPRLNQMGITEQACLVSYWPEEKTKAKIWPGDNGNWAEWEAIVTKHVRLYTMRRRNIQYDLWNEPDLEHFWPRSRQQFHELWARTFRCVRAINPQAVIVGPSWMAQYPGDTGFNEFLRFAKVNSVVPDYVSWHFPQEPVREMQAFRDVVRQLGVRVKGAILNEYLHPPEQNCGKTAWMIVALDRAGVSGACHALWTGHGNIGDTVYKEKDQWFTRGTWWVYRRYGDMVGQLVRTTPSTNLELIAAHDASQRTVRVLLGNRGKFTGTATVQFENLPMAAFPGRRTFRVVVERIPQNGNKLVTKPEVRVDQDMPALNNQLAVTLPWPDPQDAYAIQLQPGVR